MAMYLIAQKPVLQKESRAQRFHSAEQHLQWTIMENSHYQLTVEQTASYQQDGFLLIQGFLNPHETSRLQEWTQNVHDLPRTPDAAYMPYEVT
jgi:hypothetical protein